MIARHWNHGWIRFGIAAVALSAIGWSVASAAPLDKLDTSLKLIPEDAAFYSSMMRNREQFDILRHSKAWAKLEAMPIVQMGISMYQMQLGVPSSGPAKLQLALQNPEVRKVIDMAADVVSDEIFIYGDESCVDFVQLVQNVMNDMRYGPMVMQATGQAVGPDVQGKVMVSSLAENVDLIGVPNFVIGFKVKNIDLAKEELIKLEMFGNLLETNEKTKGHFKKTKVGDHDFLVLDLDGEMVPWDELPMEKLRSMETEEGDVEKIIDKLKESKLVLAIGLHGNYLLCSVGSSLDCVEKLGQGDRLIDRDEFKPLEKFTERRLTGIGYASEDMNRQINNQAKNIDELLKLADKLLPAAKLSETQNKKVRADLEGIAKDVKKLIPEAGAVMGLQFLSDLGIEQFHYSWGGLGQLDGSKPLGLLQHVGGNPVFGVVVRKKVRIEDYDTAVRWAKTLYGYFEEFGLPNIPEPDRSKKVEPFIKAAMPLVARLDKANREMLIPALADGQSALVVDAKLQSKHFVESLPATEKPMPMVEPALVLSVSNAKLLKQGLGEYREAINGLIGAVRQIEGSNVPPGIEIPEPQKSEGPLGTSYVFTLPAEWGVDKQVAPNIGISDQVAVFSVSPAQTERLLKATPPTVGGVLSKSDNDRSLAVAGWFDWAALVDVATPWVDFAIERAASEKGLDANQQKVIADQVHTGLQVFKTLRGVTGEYYLENDVMVMHSLLEIRDVEK
jgi:hypothetical protein